MARYAGLLGKADDQAKYAELAKSAGTAFNSHFFDAVNATYREAGRSCKQYLSPQTAISLADELGLIPAEQVRCKHLLRTKNTNTTSAFVITSAS